MMLSSILQTSQEELQEREVRQSAVAKGEHFQFERQAGKVASGSKLAKQTTWVGNPALSPISCVHLCKLLNLSVPQFPLLGDGAMVLERDFLKSFFF